jgi:hypothetical protein
MSELMSRLKQIEDKDTQRKAQYAEREKQARTFTSPYHKQSFYKWAQTKYKDKDWYGKGDGRAKPSYDELGNAMKIFAINADRYTRKLDPIDLGDLSINPHDYTEEYLQHHSDYVKKNGVVTDMQDVQKYATQQKFKGQYGNSPEDKKFEAEGLPPLKYQRVKDAEQELKNFATGVKTGTVTADNFKQWFPTLATLTDYAQTQKQAKMIAAAKEEEKKADDPDYTSPKDFSLLEGTKETKSPIDLEALKELGYDEDNGFGWLLDALSQQRQNSVSQMENNNLVSGLTPSKPVPKPLANTMPSATPGNVVDTFAQMGAQFGAKNPQKSVASAYDADYAEKLAEWNKLTPQEKITKYGMNPTGGKPVYVPEEIRGNWTGDLYRGDILGGLGGFVSDATGASALKTLNLMGVNALSGKDAMEGWKPSMTYADMTAAIAKNTGSTDYLAEMQKVPVLGAIANFTLETLSDPSSYVAGGVVFDALKAKGMADPKSIQFVQNFVKEKTLGQEAKAMPKDIQLGSKPLYVDPYGNAKPTTGVQRQIGAPKAAPIGKMVTSVDNLSPIKNVEMPGYGDFTISTQTGELTPMREALLNNVTESPAARKQVQEMLDSAGTWLNNKVDNTASAIYNYEKKGVTINNNFDAGITTRASNNDVWYQNWFAEHGRPPTKKEAKELAYKLLQDDNNEFYNPQFAEMVTAYEDVKPLMDRLNNGGDIANVRRLPDGSYEVHYGKSFPLPGAMEDLRVRPDTGAIGKPALQRATSPLKPSALQMADNTTVAPKRVLEPVASTTERSMALNAADDATISGKPASMTMNADGVTTSVDGKPVSRFRTNTIERTTQISDAVKKDLGFENYVYEPETAKQWQSAADNMIAGNKQGVVDDIMSREVLTPELQHAAATLTPDMEAAAVKAGLGSPEMAFYRKWTEKLTKQGSTAGKNLKAVDTAWVKETSEGAIMQAQKNVLKADEKLTPKLRGRIQKEAAELAGKTGIDIETARVIVKKKLGLPVLEEADILNINKWMKMFENEADPYMKSVYRNRAMQIVADKEGVSGIERFKALQRIFMLLNPKTLFTRNPGGNIVLGAAENVKDILAAPIDALISLKTGQRTTALNPIPKAIGQAKGFVKGTKEFGKDIINKVDTSPTRGQFELPKKRIFKSKFLNSLDQFTRKSLQVGDRPFYESAYQGRLAELKQLGKDINAEETIFEARAYALDRVFQGDSAIARRVMQFRDNTGIAGHLILPFAQTPANVFDKMLDYTPAGLGKAIYGLVRPSKAGFNQKMFVDRLARTFTGTGMIALGYTLASKGLMQGRQSKDADVAAAQRRLGKLPYSVNIGDGKSYTIDWAQPVAGPLILGADAFYAGNGKGDVMSQFVAGSAGAIDSMFSQSFLQGFLRLMSGYSPTAGIADFLLSTPMQFEPTGAAQLAKQLDPYARETYNPNPINQQLNMYANKLPVARELMPVKVDPAGNNVKNFPQETELGKAYQNFLSPGFLGVDQDNPVDKETLRLYEATGLKSQFLQVAPKKFNYKTPTGAQSAAVLQPTEYTEYQRTLGKTSVDRITKMIASAEYQKMTDEEKVKAVGGELEYANNYAQFQYLKSKKLIPAKVLNKEPGWARVLAQMIGSSMDTAREIAGK